MKQSILVFIALLGIIQAQDIFTWFKPSPEKRTEVCSEAYKNYSQPQPQEFRVRYGGGSKFLVVQSVLGSVWQVCSSQAKSLYSQPTLLITSQSSVVVYIGDQLPTPRDSQKWRAAIVFLDSEGNEMHRAFSSSSSIGDLDKWKVNCAGASCIWTGYNSYFFNPKAFPETLDISKISKTKILIGQRSAQIEEFTLPDVIR